MGEFDLSLIREFRSRPAFYDRNSPRFKDKVYTAHEWQEISNKLGYDVSLLKDRMLQLRNRYNLEKRRLEQYREENLGKSIESPWPLYDHLHFLSEHIRSRRSYKRMLPLQGAGGDSGAALAALGAEMNNSGGGNSSYNHQMNCMPASALPFANGMVTVKMELDNDSDVNESDSVQSGGGSDNGDGSFVSPHKHPAMLAQAYLLDHSSTSGGANNIPFVRLPPSVTPSINVRRMDTLRESKAAQKRSAAAMGNSFAATSTPIGDGYGVRVSKMRRAQSMREQKYTAFGDFLSSSLLELPAQKALQLVEKFTSELVKVLIQKTEAATAAAEAAAYAAGEESASMEAANCNGGGSGDGGDVGGCSELTSLNGNGDE